MRRACLPARCIAALLASMWLAFPSWAAEPKGVAEEAMRVMKTNCFSCHNDQKKGADS
jgi:mono/diheme cytochrome c family protein